MMGNNESANHTLLNQSLFEIEKFTTLKDHNFTTLLNQTGSMDELNFSIFDNNIWALLNGEYLRNSLGWTVTLIVAYTVIFIIGVIGNCMVILVVIKRPKMRTVTNMFIMNLAVADLFVIVFCVPATLLSNVFTPWVLGSGMCKGVAYVQGVSVCASAYSLAAISLDRCKAIYSPMKRSRGFSKRRALFFIFFIWVIALGLTIPWAIIFDEVISEADGLTLCIETWQDANYGKIYFLVANLFCCYAFPLTLISISNVIIWCHVTHRQVPQNSASAHIIRKMHRRTRHGVRRMLGIVTLTFCLSWLPLYILVTRVKFAKNISDWESNILDALMPLAQWLGSWNSSINPVIYAFLNSKFRVMFKSLLPSWLPFVNKIDPRLILRNGVGRATITNRTITTETFDTSSSNHSTGNNFENSNMYRSNNHKRTQRTLFLSILPAIMVKTPNSGLEATSHMPNFMAGIEADETLNFETATGFSVETEV